MTKLEEAIADTMRRVDQSEQMKFLRRSLAKMKEEKK